MDAWWNVTDNMKFYWKSDIEVLRRKPVQCHFVPSKACMYWPGTEPGLSRWNRL